MMSDGLVFNIQRYSLHDGPGIRTTVFLKGCPLCCQWCHNPEGIQPRKELVLVESRCIVCGECRAACPLPGVLDGSGPLPARADGCRLCGACVDACPTGARQLIGRTMSVAEVIRAVERDRVFYEDSGGGVTFSGGEPLMQPEFLLELLEGCGREGIHAVLDTTGLGKREDLLEAAAKSALVLYDIKAFDESLHERLTGVSNRVILENLKALDGAHPNVWVRIPVVPGFNDALPELERMAAFVARLRSVTLVNLLPFHRVGLHKFERLGRSHALDGVQTPSAEFMLHAAQVFEQAGLKTRVGG